MTTRAGTPRSPLALLSLGALTATLALTGCTGNSTPSPTHSSTRTSQSPSPSQIALKDRSTELMAALHKPTVIASAQAKSTDSNVAGSTLQVQSLVRTETSTVLTFSLISTEPGARLTPGLWQNFPVLTTPTAVYPPVTWLKEPGTTSPWFAVHNPSMWPKTNLATPPQTILYPPLPASITSVTLTSTWFEDVTVPVTSGP